MRDAYLIIECDANTFQPVAVHIWSDMPQGQSRLPNNNVYLVGYQRRAVDYQRASDDLKAMLRRSDLLPTSGGWPVWAKLFAAQEERQRRCVDGDREPIPPGVYWESKSGNFYRQDTSFSLGDEFYRKWAIRCNEFPASRAP